MSILAQLVIALAIFAGGLAAGIKWHAGQDAIAARAADEARRSDEIQQRRYGDKQATDHLTVVSNLSTQLGDARVQIASLSGRSCLDGATVRMLNDIGGDGLRAAASGSAGTPTAAASDRDVADALAICRARYTAVSDQVNKILNIEDARHPP